MRMKIQSLKSDTAWVHRARRAAELLLPAILVFSILPVPAGASDGSVLPPGLCERLPEISDPDELRDVLRAAPQFFKKGTDGVYRPIVSIRSVPRSVAVEILDNAAAKGRGGIEFVSDAGFRGDCAFYVRSDVVEVLDEVFYLNLATTLSGVDTDRRSFRMKAMILGRNQVSFVYPRKVRYENREIGRTFSLGRSVGFKVKVEGGGSSETIYLNDARNLEVQTGFPFGWEKLERIRQQGGQLHSYVLGKWRGGRKVEPIRRHETVAAGFHARGFGRSGVWRGSAVLGRLRALPSAPAFVQ